MTVKREKMFDKIGQDLLVMSKIVFKQLKYVSRKIENKEEANHTEQLTQNEYIIDGFETKIRRNVIAAVLLYTPRASDLRRIIACYDIAISLERIGDLLQNVYKSLCKIDSSSQLYLALKDQLVSLISASDDMVRNAIYSFANREIELTRATIKNDDIVDDLYMQISRDLIQLSVGQSLDEAQVQSILSMSSLSHNIERIADYATNIAESAVYLIEGENIQHIELDNLDERLLILKMLKDD
ncbi:MAG: phosphate uptake regulator PhoU [Rikenellaceae bacterium]